MATGLDERLRKIERKLGIEDEEIMQEFAKDIHRRLDRIDQNIHELRRKVFGEEPSNTDFAGDNSAKRGSTIRY
jgi:hypothetical protein